MQRFGLFLLIAVALNACTELATQGDAVARDSAKTVVNGVVEARFPGVNAAPITDCIIDNATTAELLQIAQAAALGTSTETTSLIVDISQRPETFSCIAEQALVGGTLLGVTG